MADGNIKQIKLPNNKIYNLHDARVDNLPNPMVFKGTLGSGGTISSLPAASTTNEGWTYKVITDGTYASETAKIGDAFISNGVKWELIPSGDEPSGTVTNVATGTGLTGGPITTSGTISHATGAGYNHIPSGGSSGQILRWSADGTAAWGENNGSTIELITWEEAD